MKVVANPFSAALQYRKCGASSLRPKGGARALPAGESSLRAKSPLAFESGNRFKNRQNHERSRCKNRIERKVKDEDKNSLKSKGARNNGKTQRKKGQEKDVHQPGIEPGASRWQRDILPLNHWCGACVHICRRWSCVSI
eukprot:scaffold7376_cov250-Pinguiococcus_pyrenoidosus.AAC.5